MIHSIGTDIIEVKRIKSAIKKNGDKFIGKIFSENETKYCRRKKNSYIHFAGRFVAKEAVAKLFREHIAPVSFQEIEINNGANGQPYVRLFGETKKLAGKLRFGKILISISHTENYAMATAVAKKRTK